MWKDTRPHRLQVVWDLVCFLPKEGVPVPIVEVGWRARERGGEGERG
jgi:hypothetical protein